MCQGWRQIVFTSPLSLNLRLLCTYGAPVLKTLDCWPTLPIIVQYGGSSDLVPPSPEDDDNIIAALQQSGRVSSISLNITSTLHKKLSAISEPFLELEDLALLSQDSVQLTLPSTFLWGPCLRTLHLTKIAVPSLPPLLLPCQDLIDLQLHEIPSSGYFSPEAFTNALFGTPQLRSLTLHLLSFSRRRSYLGLPPPPGGRIVLAALTRFEYRGPSKYLDILVARIDAPRLGEINITFFAQPTMDASQLGRFIERIEVQTSFSQANIETSAHAISISLTNTSTSTPLQLQISCKQVDWQLSCMAQVCDQFSPFLSRVEKLGITTSQLSSVQDDVASEQWVELVGSFDGATDFRIANDIATAVLRAFCRADDRHTTVLSALRHLNVEDPMETNEQSWDALLSFVNLRSLSGRPVQVNVPLFQCHVCRAGFRQQKVLERHLEDEHAYRVMCSYCANFEWTTGHNDLFREHLDSEHPEVASKDALIWSPLLARSLPSQLESLLKQHISLCPPGIVPSSPMMTAPHSQSQ